MKRFTETQKWGDPWFRKLPPSNKLLWQWLCDNCDGAGFINPDWELASFQIGESVSAECLSQLSGRLVAMPDGSFWIPKFIKFQYGKLSRECKTHNFVFAALAKKGIDPNSIEESETRGKNGIPAHQRLRIIARDGLICAYSGLSVSIEDVEIDHVQPKVLGGSDLDDNLVVSSAAMNRLKSEKPVEVFCRDAGLEFKSVSERLSNRLFKGYSKAIHSLQEKEKDKVKDKDKEKEKERPTVEDVKACCTKNGLPESDAVWFWNKCEANGWTNGGKPIKSWPHTIASWKAANYLPSQKVPASVSRQTAALDRPPGGNC